MCDCSDVERRGADYLLWRVTVTRDCVHSLRLSFALLDWVSLKAPVSVAMCFIFEVCVCVCVCVCHPGPFGATVVDECGKRPQSFRSVVSMMQDRNVVLATSAMLFLRQLTLIKSVFGMTNACCPFLTMHRARAFSCASLGRWYLLVHLSQSGGNVCQRCHDIGGGPV